MKFDLFVEQILSELNQSTMTNAAIKGQGFVGRNPVADQRSSELTSRVIEQARRRGKLIHTTSNPNSTRIIDKRSYILEDAKLTSNRLNKTTGQLDKQLVKLSVSGYCAFETPTLEKTELTFDPVEHILMPSVQGDGRALFLETRNDAEALAIFIRSKTGLNVSWKHMHFIDRGTDLGNNRGRYGYMTKDDKSNPAADKFPGPRQK